MQRNNVFEGLRRSLEGARVILGESAALLCGMSLTGPEGLYIPDDNSCNMLQGIDMAAGEDGADATACAGGRDDADIDAIAGALVRRLKYLGYA